MCRCKKFDTSEELVDYINHHGIAQSQIVSIIYRINFGYVLIYFT